MAKPLKIVTAAIVERGGKFLITKRKDDAAHLAGAWEFPGGKLEPDEAPEACLAREVFEEVGARAKVGGVADVAFYRYEEFNVLLIFYRARLVEGEPCPCDCAEVRWISADEFPKYDFPPADVAVVEKLRREYGV